jgi:hypothetical protein
MSEPASDSWRITVRRRLFVAAALLVAWATGIEARLLYLQVHKHADLEARAEDQASSTQDLSAKRGDILGQLLGGFFERQEDTRLAVFRCAIHQKFHRE